MDKPKPCPECDKYTTCTELCDKVEAWASQDYVAQKEMSSAIDVDSISDEDVLALANEFGAKTKQMVVYLYFKDGRKQSEVVEITGYSKSWVSEIINNCYKLLGV